MLRKASPEYKHVEIIIKQMFSASNEEADTDSLQTVEIPGAPHKLEMRRQVKKKRIGSFPRSRCRSTCFLRSFQETACAINAAITGKIDYSRTKENRLSAPTRLGRFRVKKADKAPFRGFVFVFPFWPEQSSLVSFILSMGSGSVTVCTYLCLYVRSLQMAQYPGEKRQAR